MQFDLDMPEGWIAGTVFEGVGGGPVAGAFVRLYGISEGVEEISAETITGETGAFRLERVPPGRYELEASRPGYGTTRPRVLELKSAAGRGGVDIALPQECTVRAQVLDIERRPLPGGWLLAQPAQDYWEHRSRLAWT